MRDPANLISLTLCHRSGEYYFLARAVLSPLILVYFLTSRLVPTKTQPHPKIAAETFTSTTTKQSQRSKSLLYTNISLDCALYTTRILLYYSLALRLLIIYSNSRLQRSQKSHDTHSSIILLQSAQWAIPLRLSLVPLSLSSSWLVSRLWSISQQNVLAQARQSSTTILPLRMSFDITVASFSFVRSDFPTCFRGPTSSFTSQHVVWILRAFNKVTRSFGGWILTLRSKRWCNGVLSMQVGGWINDYFSF